MGGGCCRPSSKSLKGSKSTRLKQQCPPAESKRGQLSSEQSSPETSEDEGRCRSVGMGVPVFLNIYNLQNKVDKTTYNLNARIGLGIYHTGMEIFSTEWAFSGSTRPIPGVCGITCGRPREMLPKYLFEKSKLLGYLPRGTSIRQILAIVGKLRPEWEASKYHMLRRNCNHFTKAFRDSLEAEFPEAGLKKIPAYINRAARFARVLVPRAFVPSVRQPIHSISPAAERANPENVSFLRLAENKRGSDSSRRVPREEEGVIADAKVLRTREELEAMTVRNLRTLMWLNWLSLERCRDKRDMVEALLRHQMAQQQQQQRRQHQHPHGEHRQRQQRSE
ncbi:PPPDE putative peptidase domain containing protein, putative [Trypanosoma equiperdum]|uniref:PPPDE putative peptidase domain containing protein, putative n=1 Tax=Trypanosoma equiperdum TaxID=5694 RepID=A0A1G4I376_TRYEQ|nr:PPPDE putative peptidase domain containing protein, putative [Trypanosoma equiperdum]